jgi:hypothetical protein
MDRKDIALHRAAFTGVTYGALREAERQSRIVDLGWKTALVAHARQMRRLAAEAIRHGNQRSATQYLLDAAAAYQAATYTLDKPVRNDLESTTRLRRLAVHCYRKAVATGFNCTPLVIETAGESASGYWRVPSTTPVGVVVLLNGLDSLCEAEMHVFAGFMLERNLATLAIDLPAQFSSPGRHPDFQIERWAPALTDWIHQRAGQVPIGAFGVSFGGYLVARLLACTSLFAAGLMVSPPAWLSPEQRQHPFLTQMLSWTLGTTDDAEIDRAALGVTLGGLESPKAPCTLYAMSGDRLFGPEHARAYRKWGASRLEEINIAAEHVGTSTFHYWLPAAFDRLAYLLQRTHNVREKVPQRGDVGSGLGADGLDPGGSDRPEPDPIQPGQAAAGG